MPILFTNNHEDISKVSLSSLKYLSTQLDEFLKLYSKCILMNNEQIESYNRLCYISNLLKQGRYDELFNNPFTVIDFNDNDDDYLPDYYPL